MKNHRQISLDLFKRIPQGQVERVLYGNEMCDIDQEFLGFVGIYRALSEIIPKHFNIVDLGCAYAPQAFYFEDHASYVGVDVGLGERFSVENTKHYVGTIERFIESFVPSGPIFAICSYVPPWHGDNRAMVRAAFENCFVYYPEADPSDIIRIEI